MVVITNHYGNYITVTKNLHKPILRIVYVTHTTDQPRPTTAIDSGEERGERESSHSVIFNAILLMAAFLNIQSSIFLPFSWLTKNFFVLATLITIS